MQKSAKVGKPSLSNPRPKQSRAFENVAEQRRRIMSAIGRRNTGPEIIVRSILHQMGYRFTVDGPKNKSLPGRPDIVLPGRKTVVFVHGCFWHGHIACGKYHPTKTRKEFWQRKIERNQIRDTRLINTLRKMRWKVIVIWECELHPSIRKKLKQKLKRIIPAVMIKKPAVTIL